LFLKRKVLGARLSVRFSTVGVLFFYLFRLLGAAARRVSNGGVNQRPSSWSASKVILSKSLTRISMRIRQTPPIGNRKSEIRQILASARSAFRRAVGNNTMTIKKGGDPRLSFPPDLNEILQRMAKDKMRSWLQPKSGDLLRDVVFLQRRTAKEQKQIARGI
jgi:hypothetical protein